MQTIEGFDFFPLTFDAEGKLESRQEFDAFLARAKDGPATDAIFIAHGFRNDVNDATSLYSKFLQTFRAHLSRPEFGTVATRRFVVAGVYWPSKPFRETYDEKAAGTRGLQNPAEAMAGAEVQLDDLKKDATPAQRAKLDKAATLLPALGGNAQEAGRVRRPGPLGGRRLDARRDRRAAADPQAEGIGTARETQRCAG